MAISEQLILVMGKHHWVPKLNSAAKKAIYTSNFRFAQDVFLT